MPSRGRRLERLEAAEPAACAVGSGPMCAARFAVAEARVAAVEDWLAAIREGRPLPPKAMIDAEAIRAALPARCEGCTGEGRVFPIDASIFRQPRGTPEPAAPSEGPAGVTGGAWRPITYGEDEEDWTRADDDDHPEPAAEITALAAAPNSLPTEAVVAWPVTGDSTAFGYGAGSRPITDLLRRYPGPGGPPEKFFR